MATAFAGTVNATQAPDRLAWVDRANEALSAVWSRGLLPEPSLDPHALLAIAERKEGHRLRTGHWRAALDRLTADLHASARLNPLGRTIAHGLLTRTLRQRLRAERLLQRRPDIRAIPIVKPLVILGHMRSGTTRLHRLLSCDPRFAFTRLHENLLPLGHSRAGAMAKASLTCRLLHALNPVLRRIHPVHARAAEEEFGLHALSLHGAMFEAQWSVPNFARWSDQRDLAPVYAEFADLLRILRWRRGDRTDRVQLLKAPQFMSDLDALMTELPDARIVWLDRDREQVAASTASLVWNQRRIQSDAADPAAIGAEWQRKIELRESRAATASEALPADSLIRVHFEGMERDWRREVRRVYDFLGMKPADAALTRMTRIMHSTEHRGHQYAPAQFGLAQHA